MASATRRPPIAYHKHTQSLWRARSLWWSIRLPNLVLLQRIHEPLQSRSPVPSPYHQLRYHGVIERGHVVSLSHSRVNPYRTRDFRRWYQIVEQTRAGKEVPVEREWKNSTMEREWKSLQWNPSLITLCTPTAHLCVMAI